jgi:hypothetical protein
MSFLSRPIASTGHARTVTADGRADGVRQHTLDTTELFRTTTTPSGTERRIKMRKTVACARELVGGNGIPLEHHVGCFAAGAE